MKVAERLWRVFSVYEDLFSPKSKWKLPAGHHNLDFFEWTFLNLPKTLHNTLTFPVRNGGAIRSLADGSSIIIKNADQGSCVVVWDRADSL